MQAGRKGQQDGKEMATPNGVAFLLTYTFSNCLISS